MFFSDVIVGVARSEGILSLPMVVYVDDTGTIGADQGQADREGVAFALVEIGNVEILLEHRAVCSGFRSPGNNWLHLAVLEL